MPKYIIKKDMFIDGEYHSADPAHPKVVEIHEKHKPHENKELEPFKGDVHAEKLQGHFSDAKVIHPQSHEVHSAPEHDKSKGKRPSDKDV